MCEIYMELELFYYTSPATSRMRALDAARSARGPSVRRRETIGVRANSRRGHLVACARQRGKRASRKPRGRSRSIIIEFCWAWGGGAAKGRRRERARARAANESLTAPCRPACCGCPRWRRPACRTGSTRPRSPSRATRAGSACADGPGNASASPVRAPRAGQSRGCAAPPRVLGGVSTCHGVSPLQHVSALLSGLTPWH